MPIDTPALSAAQIRQFISDGFVRLDNAFPTAVADACRTILWRATGCNPDDQSTWTKPVIRLGYHREPPFLTAANTPLLHRAFDQLVGPGRWMARSDMGTFPVRFPSPDDPGDAGWHVDMSFGWQEHPNDFLAWRANIYSRERALLMLFLFSDVGEADAPTRLRIGSHITIAKELAPAGQAGLSLRELSSGNFASTAHLPETIATGPAGTVFLCHPFLVHSAQPHRGKSPKFMAQPPLPLPEPLVLERNDGDYSPVEQAIRRALA